MVKIIRKCNGDEKRVWFRPKAGKTRNISSRVFRKYRDDAITTKYAVTFNMAIVFYPGGKGLPMGGHITVVICCKGNTVTDKINDFITRPEHIKTKYVLSNVLS